MNSLIYTWSNVSLALPALFLYIRKSRHLPWGAVIFLSGLVKQLQGASHVAMWPDVSDAFKRKKQGGYLKHSIFQVLKAFHNTWQFRYSNPFTATSRLASAWFDAHVARLVSLQLTALKAESSIITVYHCMPRLYIVYKWSYWHCPSLIL